ncbi:MAG: hypothetical protein AAF497_16600 [Planctomycetota bacterium]
MPVIGAQSVSVYFISQPYPSSSARPNHCTNCPTLTSPVEITRPIWPPGNVGEGPVKIEDFLPELSPQDRKLLQPVGEQPTAPWEPPEEQPQ